MKHITRFIEGYDCITFECIEGSPNCQPGKGGWHGKDGLKVLFVSKGKEGAVQFILGLGVTPQTEAQIEWKGYLYPFDLGYHSKTPRYEGQKPISAHCEFCDNETCYYDGSSLNANDAMLALVNGGDKALCEFLDGYYKHVFYDEKYPVPAQFKMPLR